VPFSLPRGAPVLADLELSRRLERVESALLRVQKLASALRERPTMFPVEGGDTTRPPHVVDILPALSLLLLLLSEMRQRAERLRRLEGNLHSHKVAERRRSEAVDDGRPRRPVGRAGAKIARSCRAAHARYTNPFCNRQRPTGNGGWLTFTA